MTRTDHLRTQSGQISIDYMAGALVFFGAIILLISSVLNTVPEFQNAQHVNDLQLSGWTMSEVVMKDSGHWENATRNGTDWHRPAHRPDTTMIGLQSRTGNGIDLKKIAALQDMGYDSARQILESDHDFNIEFTEFLYVDTHRTFQNGSAPSFITEPTYPDGINPEIRYGTKQVNNTPYYVLLANDAGWYNHLWISEDWDFTQDTEHYDLSQDRLIPFDERTYLTNVGDNQISNGNLFILQRQIGRVGAVPPQNIRDIVEIKRFDTTRNDNVIRGVFRLW